MPSELEEEGPAVTQADGGDNGGGDAAAAEDDGYEFADDEKMPSREEVAARFGTHLIAMPSVLLLPTVILPAVEPQHATPAMP